VYEDDRAITRGVHRSCEARLYQLGDVFKNDGRELRVFQIEEAASPHARRLHGLRRSDPLIGSSSVRPTASTDRAECWKKHVGNCDYRRRLSRTRFMFGRAVAGSSSPQCPEWFVSAPGPRQRLKEPERTATVGLRLPTDATLGLQEFRMPDAAGPCIIP
jgi:hypothetical protein